MSPPRAVIRVPLSVQYGLARVTTGLFSLVLLGVLTRVLTTDDLGRYAVVLSAASFVVVAGFQGVAVAVTRFGPVAASRPAFHAAVRQAVGRRLWLAGLAAGVVALWTGVPLGVSTLVLVAGQGWYEVVAATAVAEAAPLRYWALGASRGVVAVAGAATLGTLWGAPGAVAGTALGFSVSGLVAGRAALGSAASDSTAGERRELERFGLPLSLTAVLNTAVASGDRLLLAAIAGVAATGFYAPTYDLAQQVIWALMMVVNQSAYPFAVVAFERAQPLHLRAVLSRHLSAVLALGVPAAVGLAILAPGIGLVVLGPAHAGAAARLLPVIAVGVLLGGIKAFYADLAHQLGRRPGAALMGAAVAAVANLALNLWLIPLHGALGAAYATAAAYALGLVTSWLLAGSHLRLPLPARELAKTALASTAMAGVLWAVPSWAGAAGLAAQVGLGALVYLGTAVLLRSEGITASMLGPEAGAS